MAQVWSASTGMDVDDVWDDSELIKMYDQSIQEVYSQSTTTGVTEKTFTGEDGKTYTWKVGGKCMAPFTEDGKTDYYAASIDSIGGDQNTEVAVTFLYYGNQAVVHVKDLWENEAAVTEAVEAEKKEKTSQKKKQAPPTNAPSIPLPTFAPPVPPNIVGMVPASEREALSSMLMSWYMSGYHTGYYQALADRRDN